MFELRFHCLVLFVVEALDIFGPFPQLILVLLAQFSFLVPILLHLKPPILLFPFGQFDGVVGTAEGLH